MSKTYVCRRSRLCAFLMDRGYTPYRIAPNKDDPRYNVYLFDASDELYQAVMDYVKTNDRLKKGQKSNESESKSAGV